MLVESESESEGPSIDVHGVLAGLAIQMAPLRLAIVELAAAVVVVWTDLALALLCRRNSGSGDGTGTGTSSSGSGGVGVGVGGGGGEQEGALLLLLGAVVEVPFRARAELLPLVQKVGLEGGDVLLGRAAVEAEEVLLEAGLVLGLVESGELRAVCERGGGVGRKVVGTGTGTGARTES